MSPPIFKCCFIMGALTAGLILVELSLSGTAQQVGPVAASDTSTLRNPGVAVEDKSVASAYTKPNQCRLWYNGLQKRWDALLPKFDDSSDHYILKNVRGDVTVLPQSQAFTQIELEDRDFGRPDVFWNDTGKTLYVLSSHPTLSEFWRVGYDSQNDRYRIEVGALGQGVAVPGITHPDTTFGANSPATLYVSPNRRLWVGIMNKNALQVQHSSDGGATWMDEPITLDNNARLGVTTWTHFQNQGNSYVGLFAGENGLTTQATVITTNQYFWYIDQTSDPSDLFNWIDDSPNIPGSFGIEQSDDHVSAARDLAGNQYFAVKTESGNPTDPLIKLFKRTADGQWSQFRVTETKDVFEQSRPSIVVDAEHGSLYIFSSGAEVVSPTSREACFKRVQLESLEDLAAAPLVKLFSRPDTIFTDLITPRHPVQSTRGILLLAHNRTDETVWFSVVHQRAKLPIDKLHLRRKQSRQIRQPAAVGRSDKQPATRVR